jgi:hypothetical protein
MKRNLVLKMVLALSLVALLAGNIYASPLVTASLSGSSGDWTLNFSVTNTLGGSNDIYFFGVNIVNEFPNSTITGAPTGWTPNLPSVLWTNSGFGGSSTQYNDNWLDQNDNDSNAIKPGQNLSGFMVHDTEVNAPISELWFAYALGGTYTDGDNFNTSTNPGFEGLVSQGVGSTVPLPSSLLLFGPGLFGLAAMRRWFKN